jgi:hypothetical protein
MLSFIEGIARSPASRLSGKVRPPRAASQLTFGWPHWKETV